MAVALTFYKFVFFVPETHKERVKQAVFDVGGGRIGDYACCSWETLGQGQFMPIEGSQPFIGSQGQIEQVTEYRVELICSEPVIKKAIEAMLLAHPYETPAYECWPVKTLQDFK